MINRTYKESRCRGWMRAALLFVLIVFHGLFLYAVFLDRNQHILRASEDRQVFLLQMPRKNIVQQEKLSGDRVKLKKRKSVGHYQASMKIIPTLKIDERNLDLAEISTKNKTEPTLSFDREKIKETLSLLDHERLVTNHKSRNPWQQFSKSIERAGKRRGDINETFSLPDGSRITKNNSRCYKAPDPGRDYLRQPEIREVFCPK